ncbi:hypothetical protein R1sor_017047 [Riccia sorocarpa]|uniref:DUF4378 domain-containing protein n=1 Tax=Riccia sorocarpa TaxID=122646 RepID=A0ABD3I996_9MARC
MKKLERLAAVKDRELPIKWTSSKRPSRELDISGPLELGQLSRRDVGPQIGREHNHLTGSARRDPRKISEGPRSRSLDTRGFDARSSNAEISRDIPALSQSRRRYADGEGGGGGGGGGYLNDLFKKEFINKLPERSKQQLLELGVPVSDEHFIKPIKTHPRGKNEASDVIQVIGSPRKDSLERVRLIEMPRTPRSPNEKPTKSPFADKFNDPEWIAKCEKLNVDHSEHHEQFHHRRTFSSGGGADADETSGETSREFMLSKFFDNQDQDQDQLSADMMPTPQLSFRRMASRRFMEEEIAAREEHAKSMGRDHHMNVDPPRSSTSSSSITSSRMASPDLNADKDSPAAILRKSLARAPSRRLSFIDPRIRRPQEGESSKPPGQMDPEEMIRTKSAMLKSLKEAVALDLSHFLRTLQDQGGAVQSSSSPFRPGGNGNGELFRSSSRGSESPNYFMRSPMSTIAKSPSPSFNSPARGENVREVRGNAMEGSGGDFLSRGSPSPTHDHHHQQRKIDSSKSTIAARMAARNRRTLSQDSLVSLDRDGNRSPAPLTRAETAPLNFDWQHQNSNSFDQSRRHTLHRAETVPNNFEWQKEGPKSQGPPQDLGSSSSKSKSSGGGSSILQKIEKSHERRRRRAAAAAEKEAAAANPQPQEEEEAAALKVNHAASKSWSIATSYIFNLSSPEDMQEEEEVQGEEEFAEELVDAAEGQENGNRPAVQQRESLHPSGSIRSRSGSDNRPPSPLQSPKADDPGLLKTPVSSIESSSTAEDMPSLLADLTRSAGVSLGSGSSHEGLDSSHRLNVRTSSEQQPPQPSAEIEVKTQKSSTVVRTPERTLPATAAGPWSPGSDDSGSDGSSLDNQPSPVSVLNNSRTPFAPESKLESIESKISLLDKNLQESEERSQKLTASLISRRKDVSARSETPVHPPSSMELMNHEVKLLELNSEAKGRKHSKPAKGAPAKCEDAMPLAAPAALSSSADGFKSAAGGHDHRRNRHVATAPPPPGVVLGSRNGTEQIQANDFRRSLEIIAGSASDFRKSLDVFDLQEIPVRGRRKWDLVYTRDVLVASGFGRDVPSGAMIKWHSVSEPMDPSLFEKMEDYYKTGQKFLGSERLRKLAFYQPDHLRLAERIKASVNTKQGRYEPMHRCHLFDVVNELLAKKLGPYRNPRNPWLKSSLMRPRPTGKMLLEEIWRDITDQTGRNGSLAYDQKLLHLQLENLIGEDLYKRSQWIPSPDFDAFVERIVAELEKRIFHDLVLETVATLQSI